MKKRRFAFRVLISWALLGAALAVSGSLSANRSATSAAEREEGGTEETGPPGPGTDRHRNHETSELAVSVVDKTARYVHHAQGI
jgi:hypothetical protein